jgi:hypothetical protein
MREVYNAAVKAVVGALAIAAVAVATASAQDPAEYADARARDLITQARIAISGGPGGLARLRSLSLTGRSRIPGTGGALLDAAVDIRVLLPDRYIRIDTGTFGRRIIGYAGTAVLNRIERPDDPAAPASPTPPVLLANRFALARLIFGMATWASNEVPLKVETRGTVVEMPGAADPMGVAVSSDRGFAIRLILDAKTHLPSRLAYWDSDRTVLVAEFSDHRPTGGLKLPYHIVTRAGDRVVDELSFDAIVVNPSLKKTDFGQDR